MKEIVVSDTIEDVIRNIVEKFDSYEYINKKVNMIIDTIKDDVEKIIVDDENYWIHIYLSDSGSYGINYDYKNYPLLSFDCDKISFHSLDTVMQIDDRFIIDLFGIDMKNFEKII